VTLADAAVGGRAVARGGRLDWPLEDPKGKPLARVREIRDEVRERILQLLAAEGWDRGSGRSRA
jgi:hypothetical protein